MRLLKPAFAGIGFVLSVACGDASSASISEEEPPAKAVAYELRRGHTESAIGADDSAEPLPGGGIGPDHPASGSPFTPTDCPPVCEGSGLPR